MATKRRLDLPKSSKSAKKPIEEKWQVRLVLVEISEDVERLKVELAKMGLESLLNYPWSFTSIDIIQEFAKLPRMPTLICGKKVAWTSVMIGHVYNYKATTRGKGWLSNIGREIDDP